ncbi:1909_t:CDS:1 [Paraglomus occultum]|uniref:1909_t:CDS:1 n=1 Tax=Paraglomus occultum TaxID=144539 RepID=A0A9N8ZFW4_9GLOM|nr:1909_t:CDS:1 [Paraglomus occultum]
MHPQAKQVSNSRQNQTLQRACGSSLNKVASTAIPTSRSHSSRSASSNRRHSHKIPDDLDKNAVFFPKYKVEMLINTKNTERRTSDRPPRPPNSFFLMKNALLLILREMNLKVKMPELCRKARDLWDEAPKESKQLYEDLSSKAERLHHIRYPGYTYKPVRRQIFQPYSPILNSAGNLITSFPVQDFPVEDPKETVVQTEAPTYSITLTTPSDSPATPTLISSPESLVSLNTPMPSPSYLMVIPTPEASTTPLYSPQEYHFVPVSPISDSEPVILSNDSWNVGEYEDFPLTSQQTETPEIPIDAQTIAESGFGLDNSNFEELLSQMEGYMWENPRNDI